MRVFKVKARGNHDDAVMAFMGNAETFAIDGFIRRFRDDFHRIITIIARFHHIGDGVVGNGEIGIAHAMPVTRKHGAVLRHLR